MARKQAMCPYCKQVHGYKKFLACQRKANAKKIKWGK